MSDIEINKEIYQSLHDNDFEKVRGLLSCNKIDIDIPVANKTWISHASRNDDCVMINMLLQMGAKINPESEKHIGGPLHYAVINASLDTVKLLLDNGANPNAGRISIGALNRKENKLPILKLLIKHGLNVNQIFELEGTGTYFTALDWATDPEIKKYLKNCGAKTAAEIQANTEKNAPPVKIQKPQSEVINYFANLFGKPSSKSQGRIVSDSHPIHIHVIKPSKKHDYFTLFTTGLSDKKMNTLDGETKFAYAELFLQLPAYWKYASKEAEWNWPIKWLRQIAEYPHPSDTSLGGPVTIIANNEPPEPLGANTKMTCWMLFAEKSFTRSDGNVVELFRMVPLHTRERDYEIHNDAAALMRAFDEKNVPTILDPNRPCVV